MDGFIAHTKANIVQERNQTKKTKQNNLQIEKDEPVKDMQQSFIPVMCV